MDPDQALEDVRALLRVWHSEAAKASSELLMEVTEDLVQHVQALDVWISGGGFLPRAWNPSLRDE